MKAKRIVISGGPGSGKTTLINHLEDQGHICMPEISRDVIKQAQQEGIEQLFLTNPILFSKKLLEGRLQQFHKANKFEENKLFYDRGMPDVTAYMDYINAHYPANFTQTCNRYRYDAVFLLPPWEDIYVQDDERYESFEQAEIIYEFLLKGYQNYDYDVVEVPVGSITERTDYIIDKLKHLF